MYIVLNLCLFKLFLFSDFLTMCEITVIEKKDKNYDEHCKAMVW